MWPAKSGEVSVEAQYGIGIGGLNAASAVLVLPVILFWRRLVRDR